MGEVEKEFVIPKWYIELRSKFLKRKDKKPGGFFLSLITSMMISYYAAYFGYYNHMLSQIQMLWIWIIGWFPFFIVIYIFFWFFVITKDAKYDRFDLIAMICGSIGVDLDRLTYIPNYYNYVFTNSNALRFNIWRISFNYKSGKETIKDTLYDFRKNCNKISVLLRDVEKNKKEIKELSKKFLILGQFISGRHSVRIDENIVKNINDILNKFEMVSWKKQIENFIKNTLKSKPLLLLVVFLSDIIACAVVYQYSGNIEYTIITFLGIPPLLVALREFLK